MKIFITFFLLFSLFNSAYAKGTKAKKNFSSLRYANVVCNQKYIPMKIEKMLNSNLLMVKFSAQRKIDQFSIKNVRGIEGVTVTKFQEQNVTDIQRGEVLTSSVELSDFSGLAYVVFDIAITIDGTSTGHSVPIPVGTLSDQQISKRSKNIKVEKQQTQTKEGTSSLNAPPKKYHEMQAE